MGLRAYLADYWKSFSFVGLAVGTLFFAASLGPSLLPRHYAVQGVLSGFALAVGYAVGVFFVWLWLYLEIPRFPDRIQGVSQWMTSFVVILVAGSFLWRESIWQNSIRQLMEIPPVETAYPYRVGIIALVTGAVLIAIARWIAAIWRYVDRRVSLVVPRRVSFVLSIALVGFGLFLLANDVIARLALNAADAAFLEIDRFVDDEIQQPEDPLASGSKDSLIDWESIGIQGKNFIRNGPTKDDIENFRNKEAKRPLRVYVGMRSRDTTEERAKLALEELKRVGGFDRSVLVVATPTGTGWLDPGAVDTLEYLHGGDTAIVSMQYSYLPSWITILVDPHRSRLSARALFHEVYGYWTTLPKDHRPKLYLHGLSLGALGSEDSGDLFTVFEDPIHGGVWSGPPFPSERWVRTVQNRNPGTPMWLPTYRDGSMIRFTGQVNSLEKAGKRWGPMRLVYIQYASDPMCFFSDSILYQKPEWLIGERGPDVSPYLQWYPIVTFLQIGFDLPMATSVPTGYGHNYAPSNYIDAWIAVTQPPDWTDADTQRLKQKFATPQAESEKDDGR